MMRVLLYTGKGGVGKTTLSAATAIAASDRGHRTVVLSTDAAHSLADALDRDVGAEPTEIAPRLSALEIDVNREITRRWSRIRDFISHFLRSQGFDDIVAEEFAVLPGMDELLSLLKLREFAESGKYDVAVLDCAPTGATMRMLALPDAFRWYFEKVWDLERKVMRNAKPLIEKVLKIPLPTDDVYVSLRDLYDEVRKTRELLSNPRQTSMRIVCQAEKIVIKESQRALAYMNLFGYPVDAVFVNRVIGLATTNSGNGNGKVVPTFGEWEAIHKKHLAVAEEAFRPLAVRTIPLQPREPVGIQALRGLARELFRDADPAAPLHAGETLTITKSAGGYDLSLPLPGIRREELDLWMHGEELILQVKNWRRNIVLPKRLQRLSPEGARMDGDRFTVTFR
ncbi:MAG: ArsA family ATPase [Deltaproteobacteria bacterium]|nr:ArsA family ATPase [Deltaproteobacteria bacterium]